MEERVAGREWRMDGRGGEAAFGPLEFDGRSQRQIAKGLHSFGDVMRQAGLFLAALIHLRSRVSVSTQGY